MLLLPNFEIHLDLREPKGGVFDELAHLTAFSASKLRLVSRRISILFNSQVTTEIRFFVWNIKIPIWGKYLSPRI